MLKNKGTEPAFSGALLDNKRHGVYVCAACGEKLFSSDAKFESDSGWPSFFDVVDSNKVELVDDNWFGVPIVEVLCANCGGHLGHMFEDGPRDKTGKRYCINSTALNFKDANSGKTLRGDA